MIVRKLSEKKDGYEKYLEIDANNYHDIVTDLIGIRILHLFKDDSSRIGNELIKHWELLEGPIIYIRDGDREDIAAGFDGGNPTIKEHSAGYRSVHYLFATSPTKRKITTEIQIRTIFEEGWSEIDHTIRYPNHSENEIVEYFLTIFNRLAGNADEMGGFVQQLVKHIDLQSSAISQANEEKASFFARTEELLQKLDSEIKKNGELGKVNNDLSNDLTALEKELKRLKTQNNTSIFFIAEANNSIKERFVGESLANILGNKSLIEFTSLEKPGSKLFETMELLGTQGLSKPKKL